MVFTSEPLPVSGSSTVIEYVIVAVAPAANGPDAVSGFVPLNVQPATELVASLLYDASSRTPVKLSVNDAGDAAVYATPLVFTTLTV